MVLAMAGATSQPDCYCPTATDVSVQRANGQVAYRYAVKNLSGFRLNGVFIGTAVNHDSELSSMPAGCDKLNYEGGCACSISAPQGWTACVGLQEESDKHYIEFRPKTPDAEIPANGQLTFTVTLPSDDPTHEAPIIWTIGERGCSFVERATRVEPLPNSTRQLTKPGSGPAAELP